MWLIIKKKKKKIYRESNKSEEETTVNILYGENKIVIYTNKVPLQKELYKILGEPEKEFYRKKSITGSSWVISTEEKSKISKILLRVNLFDL